MVLLQRMHYGIIALGLFLVINVLCYSIYRVLRPRIFRVGCDCRLSSMLQEKLTTCVGKKNAVLATGAAGLLKELKTEFPMLSSVSISYKSNQTAYVKIQADEPLILVKDRLKKSVWVLTQQGLIDPDSYNTELLATKYVIFVESTDGFVENSQSELLAFSSLLTDDFFLKYTIIWHCADKIVLRPTEHPQVSIIADMKTVTNNKLLGYAITVYSANYREVPTKVDIRFENFMVCAALRGEV